jgi:SAM-dependent methyltransferase
MLKLAEIKQGELVYDLGCGDGRILIAAAQQYGARAIGFELDREVVQQARANVCEAGLQGQVAIQHADMFTLDLRPADVIFLYLLTGMNQRLLPQLKHLRPGARIISHDFELKGHKPNRSLSVPCADGQRKDLYLWVAPLVK